MTLPRFSLRVLLFAVAVLCAWLAWERSVVMERRAALAGRSALGVPAGPGGAKIPWHRTWFGDRPIEELWVTANCGPHELRQFARLFPEAKVLQIEVQPIGNTRSLPSWTPDAVPTFSRYLQDRL